MIQCQYSHQYLLVQTLLHFQQICIVINKQSQAISYVVVALQEQIQLDTKTSGLRYIEKLKALRVSKCCRSRWSNLFRVEIECAIVTKIPFSLPLQFSLIANVEKKLPSEMYKIPAPGLYIYPQGIYRDLVFYQI